MGGILSKLKQRAAPSLTAAPEPTEFRDPNDPRVLYKLSSRAKRISLKVRTSDREVAVIVPNIRSMEKAKKFARDNRDWINIQLETLPPAMPFEPGQRILIRGLEYLLVNPGGRARPKINHITREIHVPSPDIESFAGRVRRLLIREAREELEAATYHYADKLGKRVGKVSIRDQSSRWGSCITRKGEGHISYSWRLISAPPFVLEYVAAHECAHLIEANHSAAFWAIVDEIGDEVKRAKTWLNKNGALLHAVGAEF